MKIKFLKAHKSIPAGTEFELPDFCVITGKNGAGKSHLLEGLAQESWATISIDGRNLSPVHVIPFNGLNPQVDEHCDSMQVVQHAKNWWGQVSSLHSQMKSMRDQGIREDDYENLCRRNGQPQLIQMIKRFESKAGKKFGDLTESDVLFHFDVRGPGDSNLFSTQFASIFKTYHTRYIKNQVNELRRDKYGVDVKVLSEGDFLSQYGPKPWVLVNEILARAGLSYQVESLDKLDIDASYRLRLVDPGRGGEISVNDLSTGEKVLMCLALAIYNVHDEGGKPAVLLIDEPDAPLHPQYSRLLIETLVESIVGRAGTRVVMTSHSPSTVAMCPEGSVYEMSKTERTPRAVTNRHALSILTSDIPNLRVSTERRRQVFVESKNDVLYFERLFYIARRLQSFDFDLLFLEPGSGGNTNCADVIKMTEGLASFGNDLVRGIIDWDLTAKQSGPVQVLGGGRRYAIENYILDPIFVALSLVRFAKFKLTDFGLQGVESYGDAYSLTVLQWQVVADCILQMLNLGDGEREEVKLFNGAVLSYPLVFLRHNGHKYEEKLLTAFPGLNAAIRNKGEAALKIAVLDVVEDFRAWLPLEIIETFENMK